MAYEIRMDKIILPIPPSKISLKINGNNKTVNLINDGEINMLKQPGLSDISFTCILPQSKYPFASYPDGFRSVGYYLDILKRLKVDRKPFRFVFLRKRTDGHLLFDTNMTVSLEDYQIIEDVGKYGLDVGVDINLKQWKDYATKELELYEEIQHDGSVMTMGVLVQRRASDKSIVKTYTVQPGDALYTIARAVYGDGEKYIDIYKANQDLLDKANEGTGQTKYMIYPGQELIIPVIGE